MSEHFNGNPVVILAPPTRGRARIGRRRFRILFVCARNACRSPMAQGFLAAKLGDPLDVSSAGLAPRRRIDPMAVRVMKDRGIDISALRPQALSTRAARDADLIVHLVGPDEALGAVPFPRKTVHWLIEDPLGWPQDIYEDVRDEIEQEVETLADWLARTVTTRPRIGTMDRPDPPGTGVPWASGAPVWEAATH